MDVDLPPRKGVQEMFTGWMVIGFVLGAVGVLVVWALVVALVVAWVEDRHRHAR